MMNCSSSEPQSNCVWPCQSTQQPGASVWPSQAYQPCWSYQPNQANWPGMQPTVSNWPAYQPAPPTQSSWPNSPPMGPSQPMPPIQPNQSIFPSQPMPPIQPNQSIFPSQPMPPIQPNQSIFPSQPMPPIQPNQSIFPSQPMPPSQPVSPSQPSLPMLPNQAIPPGQPSQSMPPSQAIPPGQPSQSMPPSQAIPPGQSSQPMPPSQATQPIPPSWSSQLPNPIPPSWHGNPGQPGWPNQGSTGVQQHSWPPVPPTGPLSVPFNMSFPRGIYDKLMLTIRGQVKSDAKMFTVNFLRGNDIALHINPRFNEGGKQVLVRNHKLGEQWGQEERTLLAPFPFVAGQYFEMKILCTINEFKVAVNNTPVFEFKHRIREVNQIDRINILHDLNLISVNVDTLS